MNSEIFLYPITIKEVYLDTFGHMNHAMYLVLFEEARWELVTRNGYGIAKIQEIGLGPIILEVNIRYLKELQLRSEVIIETQLLSYEKKIAKVQQRMVCKGDICCVAEFTIGLFCLKERKLVSPTPEWLRAIGVHS